LRTRDGKSELLAAIKRASDGKYESVFAGGFFQAWSVAQPVGSTAARYAEASVLLESLRLAFTYRSPENDSINLRRAVSRDLTVAFSRADAFHGQGHGEEFIVRSARL
jgi:hypothetical protein